jgi:hypothetical protein
MWKKAVFPIPNSLFQIITVGWVEGRNPEFYINVGFHAPFEPIDLKRYRQNYDAP